MGEVEDLGKKKKAFIKTLPSGTLAGTWRYGRDPSDSRYGYTITIDGDALIVSEDAVGRGRLIWNGEWYAGEVSTDGGDLVGHMRLQPVDNGIKSEFQPQGAADFGKTTVAHQYEFLGSRSHQGYFRHPAFGGNRCNINVAMGESTWTTLGQTEPITIVWDGSFVTLGDSRTIFKGTRDDAGTILGYVIQDGVEGGVFELKPSQGMEEPAMQAENLLKANGNQASTVLCTPSTKASASYLTISTWTLQRSHAQVNCAALCTMESFKGKVARSIGPMVTPGL